MPSASPTSALDVTIATLVGNHNRDPFALLGPHVENDAVVVRAFQPAAQSIALQLVTNDELIPITHRDPANMFEVRLTKDKDYRLRISYPGDHISEIDNPYRYGRMLTDYDLHLLGEDTHHRAFDKLGSHRLTISTTTDVHFAVWAPNAKRMSVISDFNGWDGQIDPIQVLVPNDIQEIFIPDLAENKKYKYEIHTKTKTILKKTDPLARAFEAPPQSATIVRDISHYQQRDADWMTARGNKNSQLDRPMAMYEMHLGS